MDRFLNSYLWIPDIMSLSGFLNENNTENCEKKLKSPEPECKNNKNSCKNSKINFVKGTGRYVYWNFYPKMIIDLDWIEFNIKHPLNVILVKKEKINQVKNDK